MSYLLLCFLFLQVITTSHMDAEGDTFSDRMDSFEPDLWKKATGHQNCRQTYCSVARHENVKHRQLPPVPSQNQPGQAQMEIWLLNNCVDEEECCRMSSKGRICTQYTNGELISQVTYGYGSYYFVTRIPAGHNGDGIDNTWGCYGLQRSIYQAGVALKMAINICFPSQDGRVVQFMILYGDMLYKDILEAEVDLGEQVTIFQIDWLPDSVSFYVAKVKVLTVTSKDIKIPDYGMYIKAVVIPQDFKRRKRKEWSKLPPPAEEERGMVMVAFQIAHKKAHFISHNELFARPDETRNSIWKIIVVLGICIILFLVPRSIFSGKLHSIVNLPHGNDSLLTKDGIDSLNVNSC